MFSIKNILVILLLFCCNLHATKIHAHKTYSTDKLNEYLRGPKKNKHGKYVCQTCSRSFTRKSTYANHRWNEHKTKSYTCEFCKKKYLYLQVIRDHIIGLHFKAYICNICKKCYKSFNGLKNHRKNKHDLGRVIETANEFYGTNDPLQPCLANRYHSKEDSNQPLSPHPFMALFSPIQLLEKESFGAPPYKNDEEHPPMLPPFMALSENIPTHKESKPYIESQGASDTSWYEIVQNDLGLYNIYDYRRREYVFFGNGFLSIQFVFNNSNALTTWHNGQQLLHQLWNLETRAAMFRFPLAGFIICPQKMFVATKEGNGLWWIRDLKFGAVLYKNVYDLFFSNDGQYVVMQGRNGFWYMMNLLTFDCMFENAARIIALSNDSSLCAAVVKNTCEVINIANGQEINRWELGLDFHALHFTRENYLEIQYYDGRLERYIPFP